MGHDRNMIDDENQGTKRKEHQAIPERDKGGKGKSLKEKRRTEKKRNRIQRRHQQANINNAGHQDTRISEYAGPRS
jgi:hypothetical protein